MVVGLLGNESSDSNRLTLVTPKSENDVRLQATLLHSDRKRMFLIFPSWCFMYWLVRIGAGIFVEGYYLERGK